MYGPNSPTRKKEVWDKLGVVLHNYKNNPIIMGGDFNTIISLDEKVGGIQQLTSSSLEFKSWVDKQCLVEIPLSNGTFTWNNKRKDNTFIVEKLDRFFIVGKITDYNRDLQSSILPYAGLDHFPVCMEISKPSKPPQKSIQM